MITTAEVLCLVSSSNNSSSSEGDAAGALPSRLVHESRSTVWSLYESVEQWCCGMWAYALCLSLQPRQSVITTDQ